MGLDSYLLLKKSGQSVIDRHLPYRFLRGQPLNFVNFSLFCMYLVYLLISLQSHSNLGPNIQFI